MTVQTREAELTAEQKTMMSKLKKDLQIVVKSGQPITAANEAAARSKFLQISLGAIYDEGHKAHWVDASPRLAVLKEVIEQSPRKILLLAPFTHVLTLLEKACSEYAYAVVNGATSQKDRTEIFRRFQDEDSPEIIIADPGVLAHGLNLQRGRTIIWYGSVDKAELWQQANKRCHRPGQKYPVSVVQIVSNALEKEIFRRLANNLSLQGAMLDLLGRGEL
jgi:SNF2 family DNA or RNA helicase